MQVAKIGQDKWLSLRDDWLAAKESWDYSECRRCSWTSFAECYSLCSLLANLSIISKPSLCHFRCTHALRLSAADVNRSVEVNVSTVMDAALLEDTPSAEERLRRMNALLEGLKDYKGTTIARVGRGRSKSLRLRLSNEAMQARLLAKPEQLRHIMPLLWYFVPGFALTPCL